MVVVVVVVVDVVVVVAAAAAAVVVVVVVFYFLKVSKVYVFLKFFNFWPLYLLLELRSPRTLPDSPGLPLDTFGSRVWDPKPQTVR